MQAPARVLKATVLRAYLRASNGSRVRSVALQHMEAFGMSALSQDLVTVFRVLLGPCSRIPAQHINICLDFSIPNHSPFIAHYCLPTYLM
jgi:hypothetical protein